jgi:hypothetical protein
LEIFLSLIDYRTLYLFNNKKIDSIWKTPRSFYLTFFKIITVGLAYSLASFIIGLVVRDESLSSLLRNIFSLLFYGFFGLYHYFVIFEESSINDSLAKSFAFSKPYFWENVLRWLLFSILVVISYIGVILLTLIWIIPLAISNYSILAFIFFLFMFVAGICCLLVINFVSEIFGYLSFLNLVLLSTESMTSNNEETIPENTKNKNDTTIY